MDIDRLLRAVLIFLIFVSLGCFSAVFIILLNNFLPVKYLFVVILFAIAFYCSYLLAER